MGGYWDEAHHWESGERAEARYAAAKDRPPLSPEQRDQHDAQEDVLSDTRVHPVQKQRIHNRRRGAVGE